MDSIYILGKLAELSFKLEAPVAAKQPGKSLSRSFNLLDVKILYDLILNVIFEYGRTASFWRDPRIELILSLLDEDYIRLNMILTVRDLRSNFSSAEKVESALRKRSAIQFLIDCSKFFPSLAADAAVFGNHLKELSRTYRDNDVVQIIPTGVPSNHNWWKMFTKSTISKSATFKHWFGRIFDRRR